MKTEYEELADAKLDRQAALITALRQERDQYLKDRTSRGQEIERLKTELASQAGEIAGFDSIKEQHVQACDIIRRLHGKIASQAGAITNLEGRLYHAGTQGPEEMSMAKACEVLNRFRYDGQTDWSPYIPLVAGDGVCSRGNGVNQLTGKYAISTAQRLLRETGEAPEPAPQADQAVLAKLDEACQVLNQFRYEGHADWVPHFMPETGSLAAVPMSPGTVPLGDWLATAVAERLFRENGAVPPQPAQAGPQQPPAKEPSWLAAVSDKLGSIGSEALTRIAALETKLGASDETAPVEDRLDELKRWLASVESQVRAAQENIFFRIQTIEGMLDAVGKALTITEED